MATVAGLTPGQVLSFELHTTVLPAEYVNVKLLANTGATIARMYEDVDAIHANILSTLPVGTPASCDEINFLVVELMDGTKKSVGIPWIKEPITIVEVGEIVATIKNVNLNDVENVRRALNAYGMSDVDIKVVNSSGNAG